MNISRCVSVHVFLPVSVSYFCFHCVLTSPKWRVDGGVGGSGSNPPCLDSMALFIHTCNGSWDSQIQIQIQIELDKHIDHPLLQNRVRVEVFGGCLLSCYMHSQHRVD